MKKISDNLYFKLDIHKHLKYKNLSTLLSLLINLEYILA